MTKKDNPARENRGVGFPISTLMPKLIMSSREMRISEKIREKRDYARECMCTSRED